MALSESQLAGLQVAARRRNADDLRNLDYASRTYGYRDPGSTTPSITPSQASASMGSIPTASTPRRAAIAAPSRANLDAQLAAFRTAGQSLQSAYAPSTDLINTQKQLADLTASKELGLAKASDTPIPMGVIVGQQAAIERRASTQALPLSARIAALQAEQTARREQADVAAKNAKEAYSAEYDKYKNELDAYNKRLEPINLSAGESRYQINPDTGKYERVAYGGDKPLSMSEQYGTGAIGEYNFAKSQGYTGSFTEYQNEDANRKARAQRATIAGIDPALVTLGTNLGARFDSSPIVKQYNEVQNKKLGVDRLLAAGNVSGPQDVALVYDFMKALDPTSVVRESEYAMGANSGNIFTGSLARFNGLFKASGGRLSPQVKADFKNIIDQRYGAVSQQYNNLSSETQRRMLQLGISDPSLFLTDYTGAETSGSQSTGGTWGW